MPKPDKKSAKKSKKPAPPQFAYPTAPHIIGMDWIELAVRDVKAAAAVLIAIGFVARGYVGSRPLVAVGGTVFMLRKAAPRLTAVPSSTLVIQMTTDNIQLKRQQLVDLGLKPSNLRRQPRGDQMFTWVSDDGYTLRFVGPVRE